MLVLFWYLQFWVLRTQVEMTISCMHYCITWVYKYLEVRLLKSIWAWSSPLEKTENCVSKSIYSTVQSVLQHLKIKLHCCTHVFNEKNWTHSNPKVNSKEKVFPVITIVDNVTIVFMNEKKLYTVSQDFHKIFRKRAAMLMYSNKSRYL